MTKDELLTQLRHLATMDEGDIETNHMEADDLLLKYINDAEITQAYEAIYKWYA